MRTGAQLSPHARPDRDDREDRSDKLARLELVRPGIATAATLAHERTLPVDEGLSDLVPRRALQRGSTLATHGPGSITLALALVAEAVRQGSFLGIVAPRSFGTGTCLDLDIPLRRVVHFAIPSRDDPERGWAQSVAAVIEGFDLVLLADRRRVRASHARQLVTRTRERGSVLLRAGGPSWVEAADLRYDLRDPVWHGLGRGHGHLRGREVQVQVAGRRWHGGTRLHRLALPGPGGVQLLTDTLSTEIGPVSVPSEPRVVSISTSQRYAGADIDRLVEAGESDSAEDRPFGATA